MVEVSPHSTHHHPEKLDNFETCWEQFVSTFSGLRAEFFLLLWQNWKWQKISISICQCKNLLLCHMKMFLPFGYLSIVSKIETTYVLCHMFSILALTKYKIWILQEVVQIVKVFQYQMSNNFHICKWIFFTISSFSIVYMKWPLSWVEIVLGWSSWAEFH